MHFDWTTLTIFPLWPIGIGVLRALVHIIFAFAVYRAADRFAKTRTTIFASPAMWFLATLVGGVITAGIYWAMHHSRLNQTADEPPLETEENSQ